MLTKGLLAGRRQAAISLAAVTVRAQGRTWPGFAAGAAEEAACASSPKVARQDRSRRQVWPPPPSTSGAARSASSPRKLADNGLLAPEVTGEGAIARCCGLLVGCGLRRQELVVDHSAKPNHVHRDSKRRWAGQIRPHPKGRGPAH
jgi:hypothetical protein